MKFLPIIWCNLKRKKLRTTLTMLSIMVAFLLYGLLGAITEGLTGGLSLAGANRIMVRHRVSLIQPLPQTYHERIKKIPGVDAASHATWFGGIYQNDPRKFFPQTPVVPEEFLDIYPEFSISPEHKKAWLETRTGAIAGRATVKKYGWKIGDRIPIQGTIWSRGKNNQYDWTFDLVGTYEASKKGMDETQFLFRYDYFDESRSDRAKGLVGWYTVRVKDPSQSADIARLIDEEFANSPAETKAEPEGVMMQSFASQVGNIGAIMRAIMSAVFFTILLISGNTMSQSIRERVEELGMFKALGFTITMVGGVMGLGLAFAFVSGGDPTNGMMPTFFLPTSQLINGVGFMLGLGLVAGLPPAWQALRLRTAEALRRN